MGKKQRHDASACSTPSKHIDDDGGDGTNNGTNNNATNSNTKHQAADTKNNVTGPDLNASRSKCDKKLYRQVILGNCGIRCCLIQDCIAMHQQREMYGGLAAFDDSSDDDDESGGASSSSDSGNDGADDDRDTENQNNNNNNRHKHRHRRHVVTDDDDSGGDSDSDDDEDDNNIRDAAIAVQVGVGSCYDPIRHQGLAHLLEHVVFLGSAKYPVENEFADYVARHGGYDNACTGWEYTTYHLSVPQESIWGGIDRFAQILTAPLLKPESIRRELEAVESEFQLNKLSDANRWEQVISLSCRRGHPFRRFAWGNRRSLLEIPGASADDLAAELRRFFHQHYFGANMRMCIQSAYSLDVMEEKITQLFAGVPSLPPSPAVITTPASLTSGRPGQQQQHESGLPIDPATILEWDEMKYSYKSPIQLAGLPFVAQQDDNAVAAVGKDDGDSEICWLGSTIFCLVPAVKQKQKHVLIISWQIPPPTGDSSNSKMWRTKPYDIISHLLGHEGPHSLLSYWMHPSRNWVTSCEAGVGSSDDDGMGCASSHGLFMFSLTLSETGKHDWIQIIKSIYQYIAMIRHYYSQRQQQQDLTSTGSRSDDTNDEDYIFREIRTIHELAYHYMNDEEDPEDYVEEMVDEMSPLCHLPPDRLLDGNELYYEYDGALILDLLERFFLPTNARIDFISSQFNRYEEYDEADTNHDDNNNHKEEDGAEKTKSSRPPDGEKGHMTDPTITDVEQQLFHELIINEEINMDGTFPCCIDPDSNRGGNDEDSNKNGERRPSAPQPPQIEPCFGTRFWCYRIPIAIIEKEWTIKEWVAASADDDRRPMIGLPPPNAYIPTQFELKPLPVHDSHHPLLHATIKVCLPISKKQKDWFVAVVKQYNAATHSVLLAYEDDFVAADNEEQHKWYKLDDDDDTSHHHNKSNKKQDAPADWLPSNPSMERTMNNKSIKYRITSLALPRGKNTNVDKSYYDDELEETNGNNNSDAFVKFPPLPPRSPTSRLPKVVIENQQLTLWYCQDYHFRRPQAELRLQIICRMANLSPLYRACASLFVELVCDQLNETFYMASLCELHVDMVATDLGFELRLHGFDEKLLDLLQTVLTTMLLSSPTNTMHSHAGRENNGKNDANPTSHQSRFDACFEVLNRQYLNAEMTAEQLCNSVRLRALRYNSRDTRMGKWAPHQKRKAIMNCGDGNNDMNKMTATHNANDNSIGNNINQLTETMLYEVIDELLQEYAIEALYHGNITRDDAEKAKQLILTIMKEHAKTKSSGSYHHTPATTKPTTKAAVSCNVSGLSRKKYPTQSVLRLPTASISDKSNAKSHVMITVPAKDTDEPNTSVEMYVQVGKDDLHERVMIDLLVQIMEEPFYNELRTQDQFGYDVGCEVRWSWGIMGIAWGVTSATKSASEIVNRIDQFLISFRNGLVPMPNDNNKTRSTATTSMITQHEMKQHIVSLVHHKISMFNSLEEETSQYWDEIRDGRFQWQSWYDEALHLRDHLFHSVVADYESFQRQLLKLYDAWVHPLFRSRKCLIVQVIGSTRSQSTPSQSADNKTKKTTTTELAPVAAATLPSPQRQQLLHCDAESSSFSISTATTTDQIEQYIDECIRTFHDDVCKKQIWGRINSKLF